MVAVSVTLPVVLWVRLRVVLGDCDWLRVSDRVTVGERVADCEGLCVGVIVALAVVDDDGVAVSEGVCPALRVPLALVVTVSEGLWVIDDVAVPLAVTVWLELCIWEIL